jgi:CMP-N,N'-diacetyllegionaminic acid synthase
MGTYAIIPARSGSKGIPQKNIRLLNGRPLIEYSIAYAKKLAVDRIICSTDSRQFADIAIQLGAEVPFLRSPNAATDTAMEEDILSDFYRQLTARKESSPDLIVWLRPTFVFRSVEIGNELIDRMKRDCNLTACRTVCESESRLYTTIDGLLIPDFQGAEGKSMIRRQDIGTKYKVYSMDVFRGGNATPFFLGSRVGFAILPKICGMDLDDESDWQIVQALLNSQSASITPFVHTIRNG